MTSEKGKNDDKQQAESQLVEGTTNYSVWSYLDVYKIWSNLYYYTYGGYYLPPKPETHQQLPSPEPTEPTIAVTTNQVEEVKSPTPIETSKESTPTSSLSAAAMPDKVPKPKPIVIRPHENTSNTNTSISNSSPLEKQIFATLESTASGMLVGFVIGSALTWTQIITAAPKQVRDASLKAAEDAMNPVRMEETAAYIARRGAMFALLAGTCNTSLHITSFIRNPPPSDPVSASNYVPEKDLVSHIVAGSMTGAIATLLHRPIKPQRAISNTVALGCIAGLYSYIKDHMAKNAESEKERF